MTTPVKNDQRTIFGWAMYDWANSAYSTAIAGALLPALFADEIVPEGGFEIFGRSLSGETLWAAVVGIGAFVLFLATPVLGAIADFSATKRRFMRVFATVGSLVSVLLALMGPGDVIQTLGLFLVAQMGFVGANVFYDGFLPDISTDETIDRVSSRGFALGYIGGGVQLLAAAVIIVLHESLGLTEADAARVGVAMAGIWWLLFGWWSMSRFPETGSRQTLPADLQGKSKISAYTRIGLRRTTRTVRKLWGFPQLLLFIVAYMFYNDGVQTTINLTAVYASDTLELEAQTILIAFLIVQFIAFFGALGFGTLANRFGTKQAIQGSLIVWCLVAIGAFALPKEAALPFYGLAVVVGFILGGVQALSRSLYGSMIPEEASAEFYGFYSVFSKFSAIWGPLIFAVISASTGSGRPAILSIIAFFIIGIILLARVDVDEARRSKERWSFEGDDVAVG